MLLKLLRQRTRAGVLLYALLLSAVFALLLQFYLNRLESNRLLASHQKSHLQAQLMAEVSRQEAIEEAGVLVFDQGQSSYRYDDKGLAVVVHLLDGSSYQFYFAKTLLKEDDSAESDAKIDWYQEEEADIEEEFSEEDVPLDEESEDDSFDDRGVAEALKQEEDEDEVEDEDLIEEAD